jgi:hypothetical protein
MVKFCFEMPIICETFRNFASEKESLWKKQAKYLMSGISFI